MKTIIKATIVTAMIFGVIYLVGYIYQNYADSLQYFFAGVLVVLVWIWSYVVVRGEDE